MAEYYGMLRLPSAAIAHMWVGYDRGAYKQPGKEQAMPRIKIVLFAALFILASPAQAWGPEGHAIVAEIAQRRLTPEAAAAVERILGRGHSLASVASWADDAREAHPDTYNWHFVDIPLAAAAYDGERDCRPDPQRGDCVAAELERL
ncbi:MAG TPA: S1/P1 nuclease, partial [Burkholderiales bacterium]|nr:S1/P1 nuclease [Burkholderiales bacterium]